MELKASQGYFTEEFKAILAIKKNENYCLAALPSATFTHAIFMCFDIIAIIMAIIMDTNINIKKINLYSRLFKANLGNTGTFKALNYENKIQARLRISRPRTNPGSQYYGQLRSTYSNAQHFQVDDILTWLILGCRKFVLPQNKCARTKSAVIAWSVAHGAM